MLNDLESELRQRYELTISKFKDADIDYIEEGGISIREVIDAHFLIGSFFYKLGFGIADIGVKDPNLLVSAVFRQYTGFGGQKSYDDKYGMFATLFFGLIKDHAFFDANKRTAFLTLLYHMDKHKIAPICSQTELEDFAVAVADNNYKGYENFKKYRNEFRKDAEIKYITYFLGRYSRKIDKKEYMLTYRELNTALKRHGYELVNPHGNYIDVVRIKKKEYTSSFFVNSGKSLIDYVFGSGRDKVNQKVGQIGFPSWSAEARKGAINHVRRICNLTEKDGIDSEAFYRGASPIDCLINEYSGPLRSLADR